MLLAIFQPFGLQAIEFSTMLQFCLLYSIIAGLAYYVSCLIANNFINEYWTFGKDLIWANATFLLIGILNYVVTYYWGNYINRSLLNLPMSFTLTESIGYALILGWFVYVFIIISDEFFKNNFTTINLNETTQEEIGLKVESKEPLVDIVEEVEVITEEVVASKEIRITGKNVQDEILLNPNNIICAEAKGNYVEILIKEELKKESKKLIFRTSIKDLLVQLEDFGFIFSCHRSYVVNMNYVIEFLGNNKSKKVLIEIFKEEIIIPVSRLKIKDFEDSYEKFNKV